MGLPARAGNPGLLPARAARPGRRAVSGYVGSWWAVTTVGVSRLLSGSARPGKAIIMFALVLFLLGMVYKAYKRKAKHLLSP